MELFWHNYEEFLHKHLNQRHQLISRFNLSDIHCGMGSQIRCDINSDGGQEVDLGAAQAMMLTRIKHHQTGSAPTSDSTCPHMICWEAQKAAGVAQKKFV